MVIHPYRESPNPEPLADVEKADITIFCKDGSQYKHEIIAKAYPGVIYTETIYRYHYDDNDSRVGDKQDTTEQKSNSYTENIKDLVTTWIAQSKNEKLISIKDHKVFISPEFINKVEVEYSLIRVPFCKEVYPSLRILFNMSSRHRSYKVKEFVYTQQSIT